MNTDRYGLSGCGTQTAGLAYAGRTIAPDNDPGSINVNTEEYNGSAWTESGNLATGRLDGAGFGTQTAAVYAQGRSMPGGAGASNSTEEYNGSTWSAGENFPEIRQSNSAAGTQTAGIIFGGQGPPSLATKTTTFTYDGTDYSASAAIATARYFSAGSGGTQAAALMAGGQPDYDATEEFGSSVVLKTVTDG